MLRLAVTIGAVMSTAVVVAIVIAIVDLYLVGHGSNGLRHETVSWPEAGVHLSFGDLALLALSLITAIAAWRITGRLGKSETP